MRALATGVIVCALAVTAAGLASGQLRATDEAPVGGGASPDGLVLTGRVGGPVGDVVADGHLAYASIDLRLLTFDLTNPDVPRLVATSPQSQGRTVPLPGNLERMVLVGNRLYGLVDWDRQPPIDGDTTLRLVVFERDSDRARWAISGSLDLPAYTLAHSPQPPLPDMFVEGNRVYVAGYEDDTSATLEIVDVTDAAAPRLAGRLELPHVVAGLAAAGNYVYAAQWSNDATTRLEVIDVTDAATARKVAEVETVGRISDIVVAEGRAFVIGGGGLEVFDLADPARPRSLGARVAFPPGGVPPTPGPGPTPTPEPGGEGPMQCYWWSDAAWQDGYLYAMTSMATGVMTGSSYLWRIDVRDPARPAVLGALEIPDGGESLSLGDRLAIVGGGSHKVIDQADADRPRVAASLSDRWKIGEVVAGAGHLAVRSVAYGFDGAIEFIDLSDEHLPYRTGAVALSGTVSARDIALQEHIAYAAVQERGVLVIDAADPSRPRLLATVSPVADLRAIVVDGATAYVAEADTRDGMPGALRTFDVHDPARPAEQGRLAGDFGAITVYGTYVYAGRAKDTGLRVIDVADPAAPHVAAVHATVGPVRQLAVSGVRLLALAAEALYVFDVTNPSHPRELGHVDVRIPGPDGFRWPKGTLGLAVLDEVAYVGWSGCLQAFDVRDGGAPRRLSVRQVPGNGLAASGVDQRVATGGDVAIAGRTLVVAGDGTGLWVYSVGAPDVSRLFLPHAIADSD